MYIFIYIYLSTGGRRVRKLRGAVATWLPCTKHVGVRRVFPDDGRVDHSERDAKAKRRCRLGRALVQGARHIFDQFRHSRSSENAGMAGAAGAPAQLSLSRFWWPRSGERSNQ